MAAGGLKTITWLIRLLQLFFAIILVGTISFMIDQFRHYGVSVPRELIVPEVFSVLAIIISGFSILSVFFLGYTLQLVAAFLDLAMFAGYLASSILLRDNYHRRSMHDPLRRALVDMRIAYRDPPHMRTNTGLVRLLVGLVVIQVVLFFVTTILSVFVARKMEKERGTGERNRGQVTV
ncbi:hypothetical protein C7212DRAFT_337457 [Tuber magnatum]|uniref:MARVEL domain-containing protein n=1 Tax=Tuber magnatum TaxID=42249 RepID=A0A317SE44_9PEZI|nr:hypothetical protein C7212DRAFT_337457 [Tuber magnatum]